MRPKSRVKKPKLMPVLLDMRGYIHELEEQLEDTIYEGRKGLKLLGTPLLVGDLKIGIVTSVDEKAGIYHASILVGAEEKKGKKHES